MKKQQKTDRKLKIGNFSKLTSTRECLGTITECEVLENKEKTELEIILKVIPEHVKFIGSDLLGTESLDGFSHVQDTFRVTLEKKYSDNEEVLIREYLLGMPCELIPDYCNDRETLYTSIIPQVSPACIVDMLLPTAELIGYEIPRRK